MSQFPRNTDDQMLPSATEAFQLSDRKTKRLYPNTCQRAIKSCLASIKRAVQNGLTTAIADIPTFSFGEPISDLAAVKDYVESILHLKGYTVETETGCPYIVITWGPEEPRSATASRTSRLDERSARTGESRYDVGL